jgi:eukaryotic-like serine/threonine-protein kinase
VPPVDVFALAGTVLEGKYRIDRVVAEGGFGFVYAAHHLALDVPLALKVLKPNRHHSDELRADVVSGFITEARTTARLSHPNIARAIDTGVMPSPAYVEGLPWIALEWLDGRTLEADLAARRGSGGRSPKDALKLLAPVLDAMDHAHRLGVTHRDLKPSNVMLLEERGRVVPKVLDFGIAKITEAPMPPSSGKTATQSALITFSPGYAAPEQVSMTRTGPWTDVHALALLLVEMLSDRQPFGMSDSMPILAEILASDRPTPSRRGLDVGPWEAILERALSLNPVTRQASAGVLLDELTAAVDAAEQHWQFRQLSSANVTAPLLRSDRPRLSSEPAAATTAPEPGTTTAASASARSVGPVRSSQRTLLLWLALGAGALLAALFVLLRRPDESMPSSREPVGSVTTPRSSALPVPTESSLTPAPLAVPSASAASAPPASASVARPHVAPPPTAPASRSRPERLAPTEKFE